MADGKEYRILHPNYISVSPHGTVAIVYDEVEPDFLYYSATPENDRNRA